MGIGLGLRTVAASAVFFACTSEEARSQAPSQSGHDPMQNLAVTLSSGTVVRIRNMVVFQSQGGSGILAVYIETPTPSTEPKRLALEAKEVAGLQLKSPTIGNLTNVRVAVCRTNACLEMREKPREMFSFIRRSDGSLEAEQPPNLIIPPPLPTPGAAAAVDGDALLMRITNFLVGEWRAPVCGSEPPQGEFLWFAGGDYCEWVTPTRGRIVAQRDEQHRVHVVILNRQTDGAANSRVVLDSLSTTLRSFGLSGRECPPGSSPAGAIRSWLYEIRTGLIVHVSEITPTTSQPRLLVLAVDIPNSFPPVLCQ
jgi:hypothetical protein